MKRFGKDYYYVGVGIVLAVVAVLCLTLVTKVDNFTWIGIIAIVALTIVSLCISLLNTTKRLQAVKIKEGNRPNHNSAQ